MKHIEIINGPNLNLTGRREPEVYGSTTMEQYIDSLRAQFPDVEITYYQSNVEGELIDRIQQMGFRYDGLIVNLGGYSHTSVALRDALLAVPAAKVEVHISNIFAREEYRHHSLVTSACRGMVCGLGLRGYELALRALVDEFCNQKKSSNHQIIIKKYLLAIILLTCGFVAGHLQAQDVIVKKDGSILTIYNLEEGSTSYFYSMEPSSEAPVMKISKDEVFSVKKSDGATTEQSTVAVAPKPHPQHTHEPVTADLSSEIKVKKGKTYFSAKTPDGHELNYAVLSESEHTVTVVKGKYIESEYIIPENIKVGNEIYAVVEIDADAFNNIWYDIKRIQFPTTLKKIGKNAFRNICKLERIILPEGLEEIGDEAFRLVSTKTAIHEIYLPSTLKRIGINCFLYCGISISPNGYCMAYFSNLPDFVTTGNCDAFGIDNSAVEDFLNRKK